MGHVPSLLFDLKSNMVEVIKIMGPPSKGPMQALLHSVPPTLHQAATEPCLCQRLLDTHKQVWVNLFWGHFSFLLGPGKHTFLFVPSKSLFSQSCVNSGNYGGVNGDLPQKGLYHTQVYCTQSPSPFNSPLMTRTSAEDIQTQFRLSLWGCSGSWCTQGLFEPSESLCWVLGLILSAIFPVLQSCWGFFALGHGVSFLVGSNILLLTVIQQQVVILEFFQKLSACPSTLPSWIKC